MSPADVPAELVEKAAEDVCSADPSWRHHDETDDFPCSTCRRQARHALAAVLPDIQAQALWDVRKAAWAEGFNAAVDAGEPANVWLAEWDDITNPYGTARLTATTTEGDAR